jgi:tetratricopeptide (TPR) repeat protein
MNNGRINNGRFSDFDDEVRELVVDFESTVLRGESQFFDVDELEIIIDYYLETNDLHPLEAAVNYAEQLYPDSTSIKVRRAHWLIANNKNKEALNRLLELHRTVPDDTDVCYSLGVAYSTLGQSEKAIEAFNQAAADGWQLGHIYANIAEEYFRMKKFSIARDYYIKALDTDSYDNPTLHGFLEACEYLNDYASAVDYLSKFVKREPYNSEAWYCLGTAQLELKMYERAADSFEYAIAIDSTYIEAYYQLSSCHEGLGNIPLAASDLLRIAEVQPEQRSMAYSAIGLLYARSQNLEAALFYFRKALELDPYDVESISRMAICFLHLGDLASARSQIIKALDINPKNNEVLCSAAVIADASGNYERANNYFEELILSGTYTEQHCRLYTNFLFIHEQYDVLIEFALESLSILPHDSFYSTYLAAVYFLTNRYNKANSCLPDVQPELLADICPQMMEHPRFAPLIPSIDKKNEKQ